MSSNVKPTETSATARTPHPFVSQLADRLSGAANANTIYGQPVERDGITVIPVAKASWGVGGGDGGKNGDNGGTGGGGGISVRPVGYIEIKEGRSKYRPIFDPGLIVQIILGSAVVVAIALNGVRKIIRGK